MIKTTIKIALVIIMGLAFTATAQASDPYIGAGTGLYSLGDGVNKKSVGGGFLQIGDNFSENLGAELRIGSTGRTGEEKTLQARKKMDYFMAAYLKPKYDFNDDWMGYGLLGIASVRSSYATNATPSLKKTRTGYAYGLGVAYNFGENYSLGMEFTHMLSKPKTSNPATNFNGLEANSLSISLQYHLF